MNRRFFPLFSSSLFRGTVAVCVLLLATCGGKQTSVPPSSSAGTGSISFAVEWESPLASPASATGKAHSVQLMAPVIDVCTDYGITTVTMQVLSGQTVLAETSVPCENHGATLNNVPADNNLTLHLIGSVQGAGNVWNGYSAPFNLAASENKDLGKVTVSYTGNDSTPPTVLSATPADNATHVLNNSTIRVHFSEKMAVNTVQDSGAIVVEDNIVGPIPGTITYDMTDYSAVFTPSAPLTSGAKVSVSVSDVVTDIAGNKLGSPRVWSFTAHNKGTFLGPFLLENDDRGNADSPQVAVDKDGNAIVVWAQSDGTTNYIYYNMYNASSNTWTGATLFENYPANAYEPQVAMDRNGNAVVMWRHIGNIYTGVFIRNYNASTKSWGEPYQILFNKSVSSLKFALGNNGNSITAWQVDNSIIFKWYSALPNYLGNQFVVADNAAGSHQISIDGSGNAIAVWKQTDGRQINVWANRFSASTQTWYSATLIGVENSGNINDPKLAMDVSGNAVVVWDNAYWGSQNNNMSVWANRYSASTQSWEGAILIDTNPIVWPWDGGTSIAVDSNGNAISLWVRGGIYYSTYSGSTKTWSGIGVVEPIVNNSVKFGPVVRTQVAMDGIGNAVAVWLYNGSNQTYSLATNHYSASTKTWSGSYLLEYKNYAGPVDLPAQVGSYDIGMDEKGNALAVWSQLGDSQKNDIWGNRTY